MNMSETPKKVSNVLSRMNMINGHISSLLNDCRSALDDMKAEIESVNEIIRNAEKSISPSQQGTFTDPRDGRTYRTVKIGEQTWMAENLAFAYAGSKCYDNDLANEAKYGRLYDWETAKKACPPGWHLPTNAEWDELMNFAGGKDVAGKKLKSKSGWNNNDNGTDEYGFSALPGGLGNSSGSFFTVGNYGYWWSATESNASYAYFRSMGYSGAGVGRYSGDKSNLYSVRCVQDCQD